MSRCAIFMPNGREFYAGLATGWTKQLRLARVYADESTALRTIRKWRRLGNRSEFRLVPIHWRIRNSRGERVCDRGSNAECKTLVQKYATGQYTGWSNGPYRIMRVASLPIGGVG